MRITPNTLDKNLTPEQSAKRVQDAKNKCRDIVRKGGAVGQELQRIAARVMIYPYKKKKKINNVLGHCAKAGLCKEYLWLWVLEQWNKEESWDTVLRLKRKEERG